jgi:hypothetical protein
MTTSIPDLAITSAIPEPMMPDPITPTSFTRATVVAPKYFAKLWLEEHPALTRHR